MFGAGANWCWLLLDTLHCVRISARKWRWRTQEMSGPGHVPRATCRQSGGHGSLGRWSSAGAARGQFVTNNTKYRQVHPLPSWGNVDVFVCFEILLLEGKEAKLLNIQSFSNSNVLIFMLTYCRDSYAVTYQALSISVFRIFVDMVDRDTNATWMWMSMWQSVCVTCKQCDCVWVLLRYCWQI